MMSLLMSSLSSASPFLATTATIVLNNSSCWTTSPRKKKLKATTRLSKVFGTKLSEDTAHIIVQRPPQVPIRASNSLPGRLAGDSCPSTSTPADLRADLKKIADEFFHPGSTHAIFLDNFVRVFIDLPVTEGSISGLPTVKSRGCEKPRTAPSLMFFDLLSPVQWGFYFNASNKDQGSNDLMQLVEYLDEKTLGGKGPSVNTVFARNMARVLFLSRLLILKYCLQVPNCHQTFSSASWAILQVCPVMFEDVFLRLLSILYDRLEGLAILESDLRPIVRHELHTVQKSLAAHDYPNFSIRTKLRLVIDEAQILGDKCSGLFQSSLEDDLRPMLSAVLNGFRKAGGQDDFTILYCGTGLSIRTLHWALSSGYGVKEYNPTIIPSFIEFPGWTSPDSVQSYVDQIKDQLSDDGSKSMVDALIPPAAVDMLYKKACWSLPSNRNGN